MHEKVDDHIITATRIYKTAFELYKSREFKKAEDKFREFLDFAGSDLPAEKHLETCIQYQKDPPPPDWSGVVIMQEK